MLGASFQPALLAQLIPITYNNFTSYLPKAIVHKPAFVMKDSVTPTYVHLWSSQYSDRNLESNQLSNWFFVRETNKTTDLEAYFFYTSF